MSETTAKAIRVITLPPIIALFLIILLKGYFPDGHDLMAIVLLCGLPLLSYLYWKTIPGQYEQGRTSQRKLAIIFSVIGYVLGLLYCLICNGSEAELFMYLNYVICGAVIALSSFVFHVKSSGHAAGVTAPVIGVSADDPRQHQLDQPWSSYTKGIAVRKLLRHCYNPDSLAMHGEIGV